MHYLEYQNNIIYNKHFLQSYYSDSNKWLETNLKLYTQLQLCMREWGWITDPILFRVWGQWIVTNLGHEKYQKNAVYFFLEVVMPRSSPFFYCLTKSNLYISCKSECAKVRLVRYFIYIKKIYIDCQNFQKHKQYVKCKKIKTMIAHAFFLFVLLHNCE